VLRTVSKSVVASGRFSRIKWCSARCTCIGLWTINLQMKCSCVNRFCIFCGCRQCECCTFLLFSVLIWRIDGSKIYSQYNAAKNVSKLTLYNCEIKHEDYRDIKSAWLQQTSDVSSLIQYQLIIKYSTKKIKKVQSPFLLSSFRHIPE
jgi:hypothetical protein